MGLTKTFEMVSDLSTDEVVAWSGDDSFIVKNPGDFSIHILPCYFKHNNLSSFVRQLNIYGFRKVNSDCWEFSHPNFRRGWFNLLKEIKRRKTPKESRVQTQELASSIPLALGPPVVTQMPQVMPLPEGDVDSQQVEALLQDKDTLITEVIRLRKQQDATQRMLAATLNELHETRCEQQRTQDTVEKLISFLSTIVDGAGGSELNPMAAQLGGALSLGLAGSARGHKQGTADVLGAFKKQKVEKGVVTGTEYRTGTQGKDACSEEGALAAASIISVKAEAGP